MPSDYLLCLFLAKKNFGEQCCPILFCTCGYNPDKANKVVPGRGSGGTFLTTQIRMIYNHDVDGCLQEANISSWWKKN
jgi:hypothetical protein